MRRKRKTVLYFLAGCLCGYLIEEFLHNRFESETTYPTVHSVNDFKIKKHAIFNDLTTLYEENTKAHELASKVNILCWVLTQKNNINNKAKAVKETWGRRCNILLFVSSESDKDFPALSLGTEEGYDKLWLKTKAAWMYVFKNFYNDVDWFVKADDDTFIIMENLRYFLSQYKHTDAHYFGRNLWTKNLDYNSGGAGYVFSKETLRKFTAILNQCKPQTKAEDIATAVCLKKIGILTDDTRDEQGKEMFHPFAPDFHLIPGAIEKTNWLYKLSKWEVNSGADCCSKFSISFHYTSPKRMYLFNYYLYTLKT